MKFWNKKQGNAPEAPEDEDAAPSGLPPVQGGLKGNGAASATVLKKRAIVAAVAVALVGVGAASYYVVKLSDGGPSATASTPNVTPAAKPQGVAVPDVAPPLVAPTKSAATAPTASTTSVPAISSAPAPAQPAAPAQPPQPSPQQLAFEAAVSGGSGTGSALSWSASGGGAAAPATVAPAAVQPVPLEKPKASVYSTHLVRKEVSPYELLQGTVIPATLETGIKSDLPGEITAVVNQPVYNSVSGRYVLIPAGSKLVGTYEDKIIAGDTRVGVAWTRIEFPNGTYLQLGGMPGTDSRGYAGFHDLVNDHTWTIFKNALLLSLIDVGMSVASPTSTSTNTTGVTGNEALQDGEQALAQTFGQAEAQMFQKAINIAPTLTIRPGYAFNVVVTKDLVFPGPYKHGVTEIAATDPSGPAAPTIANPYN
jgi:type IV secretory pathway VirB10-like protein